MALIQNGDYDIDEDGDDLVIKDPQGNIVMRWDTSQSPPTWTLNNNPLEGISALSAEVATISESLDANGQTRLRYRPDSTLTLSSGETAPIPIDTVQISTNITVNGNSFVADSNATCLALVQVRFDSFTDGDRVHISVQNTTTGGPLMRSWETIPVSNGTNRQSVTLASARTLIGGDSYEVQATAVDGGGDVASTAQITILELY